MMMQLLKKMVFGLALSAAFCTLPSPSRANDNFVDGSLEKALTRVARDLLAWMAEEQVDTVAIGDFSGHPQFGYSGPLLQKTLADELEKQKKNVANPQSPHLVSGEWFWPQKKNPQGLIEIQIEIKIRSSAGRSQVFNCQVTSTRDVAKLIAPNGHIDPDGSKKDRHNDLRKQHDNKKTEPAIEIRNQTVVALKGQPFAVEILAKPLTQSSHPARPVKASINNYGDPCVDIPQGNIYEIKIHNDGKAEVAVAIAIDGLDVFTFSDDKSLKYHILEPYSKPVIVGWHKSVKEKRYDSFLLTEYGKGAISKFPTTPRNKVGQIQVQFSFSHNNKNGARSGAETGFGPPRHVEHQVVTRQIDPPHAFITIRYGR